MPNLAAKTRTRAGDVVLVLHGEVDLATAQEVEAALQRALKETDRRLVVDLRDLSFLDSTGIAILLRLDREACEAGRQLVVVKGPPHVHRVFVLTGVSDVLTMVDEVPVNGG